MSQQRSDEFTTQRRVGAVVLLGLLGIALAVHGAVRGDETGLAVGGGALVVSLALHSAMEE
ncbi:MAG: hypothetical protein ABEH66_01425 [Halobacteriales archaeon]